MFPYQAQKIEPPETGHFHVHNDKVDLLFPDQFLNVLRLCGIQGVETVRGEKLRKGKTHLLFIVDDLNRKIHVGIVLPQVQLAGNGIQ